MPIVSTVRGSFGSQGRFSRNRIGVAATGGTITTAGGYRIHTFVTGARTGGTFTFTPNG